MKLFQANTTTSPSILANPRRTWSLLVSSTATASTLPDALAAAASATEAASATWSQKDPPTNRQGTKTTRRCRWWTRKPSRNSPRRTRTRDVMEKDLRQRSRPLKKGLKNCTDLSVELRRRIRGFGAVRKAISCEALRRCRLPIVFNRMAGYSICFYFEQ